MAIGEHDVRRVMGGHVVADAGALPKLTELEVLVEALPSEPFCHAARCSSGAGGGDVLAFDERAVRPSAQDAIADAYYSEAIR
jgi:hypothetical protein